MPLFVHTVSVPEGLLFALIKSSLPSPFTSAAATANGLGPTLSVKAKTNPPVPSFVNTVSVPGELPFAVIKSSLPSPLPSAATTERGALPTPGEEASGKLPGQDNAPEELRVTKLTFVTPAPLPVKVPVRLNPLAPLVTSVGGNCASGI